MSTIDPARVRRERSLARQGSSGAATAVVLSNLILLVGGGAGGWAAASDLGLGGFRDRALNHFFAEMPDPVALDMVVLPASVIMPLIGMFALTASARAYTGVVMSFPVVGPLTVWLVGAAAGLTLAVRRWPEPLTLGVRTDPVFGDHEVWSSVDWAWYHAGDWIPWVAVAVALLSLVAGIVARRRKARRRRELDCLIVEGQRAVGDVTKIPTLTEGSAILTSWTVHFVDRLQTDRWVTSQGKFPRDELPKLGDRVAVLYDPTAPGDKRRIYLGRLEARTAEDFLRWRL